MNLELALVPNRTPTLQLYGRLSGLAVGSPITGAVDGVLTYLYVFNLDAVANGDYEGQVLGISTPNGDRLPIRVTDAAIYTADEWWEIDNSIDILGDPIPDPASPGLCTVRFIVRENDGTTPIQNARVEAKLEKNVAIDNVILTNVKHVGLTNSLGIVDLVLVQGDSIIKGKKHYTIKIWDSADPDTCTPVSEFKAIIPNLSTMFAEDLIGTVSSGSSSESSAIAIREVDGTPSGMISTLVVPNGSLTVEGGTGTLQVGGSLTVREADGTPSGTVNTIVFENGTVSIAGSTATITGLEGPTGPQGIQGIQGQAGERFTEQTYTPTGTTQTIDLNAGNLNTLSLGSTTGNLTLTLTVPTSATSGRIKFIQHGTTARDVTIVLSSLTEKWFSAIPTWTSQAVGQHTNLSYTRDGSFMDFYAVEEVDNSIVLPTFTDVRPISDLLSDAFAVSVDSSLLGRPIGTASWVSHDLNTVNTPVVLAASNAIDDASCGTTSIFLAQASSIGADQKVSMRVAGTSLGAMLLGRFSKTARNGYSFRYNTGTTEYQLGRWDAGTYTILSRVTVSQPSNGVLLELRCIGNVISGFANGTQVLSLTDSTYTTSGHCGVRLGNIVGHTIYDFCAAPASTVTSRNVSNLFGQWERSGSSFIQSARTGSIFSFRLSGRYAELNLENPTGITGYLVVTRDDVFYQRFNLRSGSYTQPIFFSSASVDETIKVILAGNDSVTDNWTTPTNATRVLSINCQSADSLLSVPSTSRQVVVVGDSISRGRSITDYDFSLGAGHRSWPYLLGRLLNADTDIIAWSGQGFGNAGAGNVPDAKTATSLHRNGVSRSSRTDVTHCYIAHGTNDGGASQATLQSDATTTWNACRTLYPNARIYVVLPLGYSANTSSPSSVAFRDTRNGWISSAFTSWADGNSQLLSLVDQPYGNSMTGPLNGGSNSYTTDLIHPNSETNELIADRIFSLS